MTNEYIEGGRHALMRAARFARTAGKKRSYAWLKECADLWSAEGHESQWPPAPAYKGPVVLVGDPEPGLKKLTAEELETLREAVRVEHNERFLKGDPA